MRKPWEDDSCATVQACYAVYAVPVAAALWCGVPAEEVTEELRRAVPVGQSNALARAILRHSYLPCLESHIRELEEAKARTEAECDSLKGIVDQMSGRSKVHLPASTPKKPTRISLQPCCAC